MGTKITPILQQLMDSEYADTVNAMLDAGESANNVHKYLQANGYNISASSVYKYAAYRKEHLLDTMDDYAEVRAENDATARKRLLKELDALDMIIEKGYQAVQEIDPADITPKIMMDAIRLKNELTGGSHALLTELGYTKLRKLEERKWVLVTQFMMAYVQEDKQAEVLRGVEEIEESIYEGTPWHDDYLRAKQQEQQSQL